MHSLADYTDEDLAIELENRKNSKMLKWRAENVSFGKSLTQEFIDVVAPYHSTSSGGKCLKIPELLSHGYSHCNRCSLLSIMNDPIKFQDIRVEFTVDFTHSSQTSFK